MPDVLVIMSTYNGEKYLVEQLDSILSQKDVNVTICVRDDGSTDGTLTILNEYEQKFENINVKIGTENLGPAKSFLDLLNTTSASFDYFSYADQDDVWFPNKLKLACEKLDNFSKEMPSLYSSTYDVVDENLNLLFKRDMNTAIPLTLEATLIDRSPSGCTMVFNRALREIICSANPENIRMHDFWTLLTVEAFRGNIYFDDTSTMLYRQHLNNTVGYSNKDTFRRIKRLVRSVVKNRNERQKQAISLYNCYKEKLDPQVLSEIEKIVFYRVNLSRKIQLLKSKNFVTDTSKNNLLFKFSVFLGLF